MGQPEDYKIDEEPFEETPKNEKSDSQKRRLFRDRDNSYIGGVSSGFGYYFGIEPLIIRLLWVLLIFGAGTGLLLYIILWILIPAANTTAEKLSMMGKPINITNIEKKVKEEFDANASSGANIENHETSLKTSVKSSSGGHINTKN
jgi:phage shock protein PspC (stress-responsive transcriptional regulator)